MKCKHCGSEIKQKVSKDPWCMYKFQEGRVINRLFDPDGIPDGWYDSPKSARNAVDTVIVKPKKKRRTKAEMAFLRGADNVNSAGTD